MSVARLRKGWRQPTRESNESTLWLISLMHRSNRAQPSPNGKMGSSLSGLELNAHLAFAASLPKALSIPETQVRVIVPDTGSAYGGKHTGEAAVEAARLARPPASQ